MCRGTAKRICAIYRSRIFAVCAALILAPGFCTSAMAGQSTLKITPPTKNEDGTDLTDLDHYVISWGCQGPGIYPNSVIVPAPASSYVAQGLPDAGNCYFVAQSVNEAGVASAYSNEAVRNLGLLPLAGPVLNLQATAIETTTEGGEVTTNYTGGSYNNGNSASPSTGVHGLTINAGDLVVIYINSNSTTSLSHGGAEGTAFTRAIDEVPLGETARQALFWKIAGASEPSSYNFSGGNALWKVLYKVFSATNPLIIDAAAVAGIDASNESDIVCTAASGETVSDGALSIVFGGKDNRSTSEETYDTVGNSYVSPIGSSNNQMAAGAHRIFTTGETISFSPRIEVTDLSDDKSDKTYSVHVSFVEDAGGGTTYNDSLSAPLDFADGYATEAVIAGGLSAAVDLSALWDSSMAANSATLNAVDLESLSESIAAAAVDIVADLSPLSVVDSAAAASSDIDEQVELAATQSGLSGTIDTLTAGLDLADGQASQASIIGNVTEPVDLTAALIVTVAALDDFFEQIDLEETLVSGTQGQIQAAFSSSLDLSTAQSVVAQVADGISGAAEFGSLLANTATAIAALSDSVDFSMSLTTGNVVSAALAASVELQEQFATLVAIEAAMSGDIDLASAKQTVLAGLAGINESAALTDVLDTISQQYSDLSAATALADAFLAVSGEVAGMVRILAASRNRYVLAARHDSDISKQPN